LNQAICFSRELSNEFMLNIQRIRYFTWMLLLSIPLPASGEISVSGLSTEAETNVKLTLSLAKEKCDTPEWKIRQLFNNSNDEIDEAMRALGYYHASSSQNLSFDADCWQADFVVEPGPSVIIDSIDIIIEGDAKDDAEFIVLRDKLLGDTGTVLNHSHYEKMKSWIETLAMEHGYLKGQFVEKELLVDKEQNSAQIKLVYDAGKRFYFGELTIDQDILEPDFVSEFIQIKPGEFYSSSQLAKTHNALSRSGYFEMVDIQPEMDEIKQLDVPISMKLYPKKIHHYSIGVGYDTDKGPLLGASYINRRLNRRGHFLTSEIDLSPVLSTADVEYNVPLENPMTEFFSFGGGLKRERTDSFNSLSGKLSARLKHAYESGWKQTLYLDSVYEKYTAASISDNNLDNNTLLLLPGGSWLLSVADNPLRPTRGHRLDFNIAGSYKNPISDISLVQGSMAAVWTHPVPWDGRIIARAEQGATWVDDFERLPSSYRFYAGGMNSIRGYSYKELGPKDNQGNVIGGRFLSVVSLEYEQTLFDDWGVAAFIDGGNAYNLDNIQIKTGVGLGARWYSPIGPIRVDFAIPLDEADSSFQIHFAAGTRL
jgi:translocation and assembly module TamA